MVLDWYSVTVQALQNLWQGFIGFIPVLIGAIIVFVIGWFISIGVGKLITEILKKLKFNQILGSQKSVKEPYTHFLVMVQYMQNGQKTPILN